jgi:hypothetical protein
MMLKLNKTGNVRINVLLSRFLETIFAMEKQQILHILSVFLYYCIFVYLYCVLFNVQSACAVLCHQWSDLLYHVFLHNFINSTIFGKNMLDIKRVLNFSTTFV